MIRARSVAGPLRRAHPASGATWNVQVVKGKMSSQCLWHACRALCAGLLLMLLGAAMAVIGYYADTLSVALETRGNATVSVKDEARGFHLNNLSYAGPIVMGFGGFIVVAACVMTFEARDSAAKVTPARPQSLPRPVTRRAGCAAPARLDQLGVYRLPHVVPLPHQLPLAPVHYRHHRLPHGYHRALGERERLPRARFGSAPDLRGASLRAPAAAALRRPLRRYALSVDEPPHSAVSASAAESECGSQSSLALDLHGVGIDGGGGAAVTLRVRDNTRRRPLARQPRLRDDQPTPTPTHSARDIRTQGDSSAEPTANIIRLSVGQERRACSAPPTPRSPPASPRLTTALAASAHPLTTASTLSQDEVLVEEPEEEFIQPESEAYVNVSQINTLESQLTANASDINALESQVIANECEINTLESEVTAFILSETHQVTVSVSEINTLATQVTAKMSDLNEVGALNISKINTFETVVTTNVSETKTPEIKSGCTEATEAEKADDDDPPLLDECTTVTTETSGNC